MLDWLDHWYLNQCDGEWEHEFGITIQTTDNPGWLVTIDLSNTKLEEMEIPYILREGAKDDWIGYSIEKKVFKGVGDPTKLGAIIKLFKEICDSN